MWKYYNPNPAGRIVGDCTIRAVAKALGTDWDTAATYLFVASFQMKDVQNANSAVASVLLQNGFRRDVLPDTCSGCTTFEDYVRENQNGTHVLCAGRHMATAEDGILYDAWDSSAESLAYAWTKEE